MSVKIALTDRNDRAKADYEIFVQWKGSGQTHGKTNNAGVYDTGMNGGTISRVTSYGEVLHNYDLRVDSNQTLPLKWPR